MNPVTLLPIIGKVIDTASDFLKSKHNIDEQNIQNEKIKEQNRHEGDMNKDKLIEQAAKNSQRNLEKSQSNEDAARQREYKAMESEKNEYIDHLQRTEILLESKMANSEKHLNQIMEYRGSFLDEKHCMLNSIYDEKDKSFNRALSIMNDIVDDGMDAFSNYSEHRNTIEEVTEYKAVIIEANNKIRDELAVIRSDISRLTNDLMKEEAKYDQLIELKCSLNNNDYRNQFIRVSTSMLETANKINDEEIYLIKKEHEKRNGDEKLHIINSQIRSMERKEFDALSSIKASFYAQKIIHDMSFNGKIRSDGNINVLGNDKSLYPAGDVIDVRLQSDSIKTLDH
ncbi:hypothetical protein HOB87_01605 [Candidatus Woesearchaeota archaeon]|jgi:hypothetical protein|nr:hypothetical protein [Candidatus Woesearchaeota archaeon]MBT6218013.1 hypothetical protein [Candidatus Neomarinimicrobiota bacterium]MBT7899453.1 hypothetical protein [Candidatus Neomarinimicrobiota bacterium]